MDLAITQEFGGLNFVTSDGTLNLLLQFFSVRNEFDKNILVKSKDNDVKRQIEINFDKYDSITYDGVNVATIPDLYTLLKNRAVKISITTNGVDAITSFNQYLEVAGNGININYYSGVVSGNPSGNKNIETIEYLQDSTVILTQTFTYDSEDYILTVRTT
jgi:hypothetical protein